MEARHGRVDVGKKLGWGRVAFGPLPFRLQCRRELIGVLHAFNVHAGAGVTVPEPGAAGARVDIESMQYSYQFSVVLQSL